MPRLGQKIFDRRQQIRTQTPPFPPDRFEVPPFKQPRKKSLSEILRFLRFVPFAPHKSVEWPPISSAKLFERCFCRGRSTSSLKHYAPVSSRERRSALSFASRWTNRG